MIIKKAKFKSVRVWRKKEISPEQYGCDNCRKPILEPNEDTERLEVKAFFKDNGPTKYFHFCSWDCVLAFIPKIKSDYFIDLPFIMCDQIRGGVKEFLSAIKKQK